MRHQTTLFSFKMGVLLWMPLIALLAAGCPTQDPNPGPGPGPDPGQTTDADNDEVRDNADDCLNTPANADVDEKGCAESQRDTDKDTVMDDVDTCEGTPAATQVDANGCAETQRDDDHDMVSNGDDECPGTAGNTTVNAVGCPIGAPDAADADEDNVGDDVDECLETPRGETVNGVGCAASQLDSDNDMVMDDADRCADTPAGTDVNDRGCPILGPDDPDMDGDGIADANDDCKETPANSGVDNLGCAESERDTDNDGVKDDKDQCQDTIAGTAVDAMGCPPKDPPSPPPGTVCSNGIVETGEECEPPNTTTCDANCRNICGNTNIDPGEECDPPNGETCDATCQTVVSSCGDNRINPGEQCDPPTAGACDAGCLILINDNGCGNDTVNAPNEQCDPPNSTTCDVNCMNTTGGSLANNNCANPIAIGNGLRVFSNVGATTDGPDEPGQCEVEDYTQVDADIWYCYSAPSAVEVVVSLCGSNFDTKMMVYEGCACPNAAATPIACSDDDCGAGFGARTTINAVAGNSYLIRIGGFEGDRVTGDRGRLSIYPVNHPSRGDNACNVNAGDCFTSHPNPGCDTNSACTATCGVDQYCCDVEWDSVCATKANGITNGFTQCGPAAGGSCFDPSPTGGPVRMGCDDATCCNKVCTNDPFCCLTEWDMVCADAVGPDCGLFADCANSTSSCFSQHAGPGCSLDSCCNMICENDPSCCGVDGWDDVCVEAANTLRDTNQCQP